MDASLLTSFSFDKIYYDEHKEAGLDYLGHGDWQSQYGKWIVDTLEWKDRTVLDIGCACGSIVRGFGDAGAFVSGCDINEHSVNLGRNKWPDMRTLLKICDATNLHFWNDDTFYGLHSAQVFEHFRPHQVAAVLTECHRVIKKNGLMFCALDTTEMYARQNRKLEDEDPTHRCVRSLKWWRIKLQNNGWEIVTDKYKDAMVLHSLTFFKKYDWDYFVAKAI